MSIRQRLQRKYRTINEETEKVSVWHSVSYHTHFDGYAEYRMPGKDGRTGPIRHIYVAEYYCQKLTRLQRVGVRLLYGFLSLCASGSYIYAACIPVGSNRSWYVNLPQAFLLPCLFWLFASLLCYIVSSGSMKRRAYKFAVGGVRKASFLSGSFMILSAISAIVHNCIHKESLRSASPNTIGLFLLAGLLAYVLYFIESQVPYEVMENEASVPPGGILL